MNTLTSVFASVILFFSGLFVHPSETVATVQPKHTSHHNVSRSVSQELNTAIIPGFNKNAGLGIEDSNNNGVRDDIDILIAGKYRLPVELKAATQYAQALQMMVFANGSTSLAVPRIFTEVTHSVDCAFAQMGATKSAQMMEEIRAATINTKERSIAYYKTDDKFSGQHATIIDDDSKMFCK